MTNDQYPNDQSLMTQQHRPHVAYILRSYPRLSQTFVLQEIWALEQLGVPLHIFAMTNPHESIVQAQVAEVQAPVDYLEPSQQQPWLTSALVHLRCCLRRPWRYAKTLWYVWRHPECDEGYTTASRCTCFHFAVHLTERLHAVKQATGQTIDHLHAHFAHDPTLIAQLVHFLTGLPFSFTAHARDLYQIPQAALVERLRSANLVITCCGANLDYLKQVAPSSACPPIHLIHHGVNLALFQPTARAPGPVAIPLLLSVGRLVTKKGFADLLAACALLKTAGHDFRCLILGEGPLQAELATQITALELTAQVQLLGACTQSALVPLLQQADIFVLTPCVTDDGDRDGVPNVLVEAMACGLPVVSTTVGGIPELVTHQVDGLLAAPHDVPAIAELLLTLLADATLRQRLGAAAHKTVTEHFDLYSAAYRLAALFAGIQPSIS